MKNEKLLLLIIFTVLTACDDNNKASAMSPVKDNSTVQDGNAKPGIAVQSKNIEMIKIDEKMKDASYDLGYRDKTLSYPKVIGDYPENVKSQVNIEIEKLANAFRCRGIGDQSFTANIAFVSEKILSFKYEAMRMCPKSPGPDSTEGAYTYNLQTGIVMDLNSEFINESTKNDFTAMAIKRLTQAIAQKEHDTEMECPKPVGINYFVVTDNGLVVGYHSDQHYYSACTAEVRIGMKELKQYMKNDSLFLRNP